MFHADHPPVTERVHDPGQQRGVHPRGNRERGHYRPVKVPCRRVRLVPLQGHLRRILRSGGEREPPLFRPGDRQYSSVRDLPGRQHGDRGAGGVRVTGMVLFA